MRVASSDYRKAMPRESGIMNKVKKHDTLEVKILSILSRGDAMGSIAGWRKYHVDDAKWNIADGQKKLLT